MFELALEEYFDWLWERSGLGPNYSELLMLLYEITYEPLLVDDENRRADGNELFQIFCEERGYDIHPSEYGVMDDCSVLEMLLAFAARINTELIGDPLGSRVGLWFSRMLENLGIFQYDDEHWDREKCEKVITFWMFKKGDFHLFPLKKVQESPKISEWERVNLCILAQFV